MTIDVLVTGADGFIGRVLVRRLQDSAGISQVVGVSRTDYDLADGQQAVACIMTQRPKKIVHLAASVDRSASLDSPERQWRDTFTAGRNVLQAASDAGVSHVLMAGSIEELGAQSGVLGTEMPPRPESVYGVCKAALGTVADYFARTHPMRIDWFRPFNVYGPGQRGPVLIPYALNCASAGRPGEFTDGTQVRDFLYVDDLAEWIVAAVTSDADQEPTDVLVTHHLGTGIGTPVRKVLEAIAAMFPGTNFAFGARPRRPGEPEVQVAPRQSSSHQTRWQWAPSTELNEGLRLTVDSLTAEAER